jgi:hypothetical protein
MSFVRPEALAAIQRFREVAVAAGAALFGLWLIALGGVFFSVIGALLVAGAVGLAVTAIRRLRFGRGGDAPGIVRIDEGAVAYFGPETGGVVALSELVQVEAVSRHGIAAWRLTQADGAALLIPVGALGSEALFDVFAILPGARASAFLDAHRGVDPAGGVRQLWRRDGTGADTRPSLPRHAARRP